MKFNKLKAFTLAEIMVLLLTLSILLAAFAPVFTRRYENVNSNEVWTYIPGDDNYNAYFDSPNRIYVNSAFIGLAPKDTADVVTLSKNGEGKVVYSKLIISASEKLGATFLNTPPQHQMQFRYGSSSAAGSIVGTLFAGNGNMIVGGPTKDITNDAVENTAFGLNAMKNVVSASGNTAVGASSLKDLKSGHYNTAVGYGTASTLTSGSANTLVGAYAGYNLGKSDTTSHNTLIGYEAGMNVIGYGNTAVGFQALTSPAGNANTAVGTYALKNAKGTGNTALGSSALINMIDGNYNTAVGANSCMFIGKDKKAISKVTCIGEGSASEIYTELPPGDNVPDRVFIGRPPKNDDMMSGDRGKPYAVVEVHNSVNGPNQYLAPVPNGEESVIINGNLIVRGLSYFEVPIFRTVQSKLFKGEDKDRFHADVAPKGLVLFNIQQSYDKYYVFAGFDGADRSQASFSNCRGCKRRQFDDVRPNCICTSVGPGYAGHTTFMPENANKRYSSTSYDWNSKTSNQNGTNEKEGCGDGLLTTTYQDLSTCTNVKLSRQPGGYGQSYNNDSKNEWGSRETDMPYAHLSYHSLTAGFDCCPNLRGPAEISCGTKSNDNSVKPPNNNTSPGGPGGHYWDDGLDKDRDDFRHHDHKYEHFHSNYRHSDIRLKNVGEKFTAGLDEIKKLRPYHYTFKFDKTKLPQVGVMAQDLKLIFPTAVDKGADGYYRIRFDEMFYAAINAVKTLNAKIESLASKIATDRDRIAALKRDNAEMYAQLDKLVDELEDLEAKKK